MAHAHAEFPRQAARPAPNLRLVLCWHMHQPQYRDPLAGHYLKSWTWLHGIKDYADMAAHLETMPGARAVVNFSTVLLQQLSDHSLRIAKWRENGSATGDALLDALGGSAPYAGLAPDVRLELTRACLQAHESHMITAFAPYSELVARARESIEQIAPLDEQTFRDLLVWYHLVWTGESLRREFPALRELFRKARQFSDEDARRLLILIGDILAALIPRYRRLAEAGRIELSVTPHGHPILPLLIDMESAREAMPGVTLPDCSYPGGEARSRWHLDEALEVFEQHFGHRPRGCWPSEGALSEAVLCLLRACGFEWTATGSNVLRNSVRDSEPQAQFQVWQRMGAGGRIACFFRDDELSDRIGFRYSDWDAEHAVDDLVTRLEDIREHWKEAAPPVVSIIMDGENAWEHFPYNAWFFLQHLYSRLVMHPHIELTTFSELLDSGIACAELPPLVAGSWVYGDFSVWIGDPHKNRAWELLCDAKKAVDRALQDDFADEPVGNREAVLQQLGVCEASDWFWWLGAGNRTEDSADFYSLFRQHLTVLYRLIGKAPPLELAEDWQAASPTADAEGAMRRANR